MRNVMYEVRVTSSGMTFTTEFHEKPSNNSRVISKWKVYGLMGMLIVWPKEHNQNIKIYANIAFETSNKRKLQGIKSVPMTVYPIRLPFKSA
jgi:hypothetical protein